MKVFAAFFVFYLFLLFSQAIRADVIFEREPSHVDYNGDITTNYSGDYNSIKPALDVQHYHHKDFALREISPVKIPSQGERVIVVNPHTHRWAAYAANGKLLRSGLASAGSSWCEDLDRSCRTRSGTFRIYSLGSADCISKKFPLGEGGAPMPYCMYFNGGQAIHGSHELANANISHGCVRVSVSDAHWLRFNFVHFNTKIIVKSY